MAYVCITYVFINNISLFFYQQMLVLLEMLVEGSEPTTSPPSLLPSPFPNHWAGLISPNNYLKLNYPLREKGKESYSVQSTIKAGI